MAWAGAAGCGSEADSVEQPPDTVGTGGSGGHTGTGGGTTTVPEDAKAVLEIFPLDIWAEPLPEEVGELTVNGGIGLDGYSPARIYLDQADSYAVHLAAVEHEPLDVTVSYDGSESPTAATIVNATAGHGAVMAHATEVLGERELPVHRLYLGIRHKWFSAEGRPARRGNAVDVYMDGEAAWSAAYDDLRLATNEVLIATWWWQSDFELVRDEATHAYLTPEQRWQNTMLGLLEASEATSRVLVGQLWGQDGILSGLTVDDALRAHAEAPGDLIEHMGQANPTEGTFEFAIPSFNFSDRLRAANPELAAAVFDSGEAAIDSTVPPRTIDLSEWPIEVEPQAASYHQKFAVIDHDVAYIGGMNVKTNDWDTPAHAVFDARRMEFGATVEEREAVMAKEALPDNGPRKDYIVRVEGPSAQDAAEIFKQRWDFQRATAVEYSEYTTDFDVVRDIAARPGGQQVQVTATLPAPFWEHAIAETWFNAVRHAERYIFIEDQYFRIPMLNEVIVERMAQVPDLVLVVITKPINEWTDPGCAQTYLADELFKSEVPGRYFTFQLRSFDTVVTWGIDETESRFADIDVHSKVLIVDDLFASIGSANKNNRGIVYEGELNVALVDAPTVTELRRAILANIMPGAAPTDEVSSWVGDLLARAAANDTAYANWEAAGGDLDLDGLPLPDNYTPHGLVYSLEFGVLDDCLFESVGPDMTNESVP